MHKTNMNSKVRILVLSFFSLITIIVISLFFVLLNSSKNTKYEWHINELNLQQISQEVDDSSIIIAFLDTGLSSMLIETYKDRIFMPYNVVYNNTNILDKIGHGTKIASVAIGTNDGIGLFGVSQKSKIMPVVIVDDSGSIKPEFLAEGIYYAVDNGANIINISMGSRIEHEILTEAINYAHENQVIVIAAVGDNKENQILYPARNETVISVQAGSKLGGPYYMSNAVNKADFRIPGEEIKCLNINGKFEPTEGSSVATAIMSGIVSLLLSKSNNYNNLINYLNEIKGLQYLNFKNIYDNY